MLFENINFLLRRKGAPPLLGEEFLALDPEALWEIVSQLDHPFEVLNSVDLSRRHELLENADIKLVVLDVDGVLTDGGLHYSSSGEEMKTFDVKDGMAIKRAMSKGTPFAIISASSRSEVIKIRAQILGIEDVFIVKEAKLNVLESLLYEKGIGFDKVAYIGDDINDVEILEKVGISAVPSDAAVQAKNVAKVILQRKGGQGCVREFIETYITSL